jgi:O-antigen ligase
MQAIAVLRRNRDRFRSPAGPALKACGLLLIAALILVAVIHSLSRMGFLVTLAALFVMGALGLGGWMEGWKRWLPAAAVALGILLCLVFLPIDPLIARFAELAAGEEISSDARAVLWQDTSRLILAYPLAGCGLGAYKSCFLRYKTVAPMFSVDFAHNDYLQVMAELGIPVMLAGLALVLRIYWNGVRTVETEEAPDNRYLALACTGSLTAILLHSLMDFNLYIPANALLMAWILGVTSWNIRGAPGPAAPSSTR